jgi:flagellar biosynthesis protein FliQ
MLVGLVLLLPFMMTTLIDFTREVFDRIVATG